MPAGPIRLKGRRRARHGPVVALSSYAEGAGLKVLVIDDHPLILEAMAHLLQRLAGGVEVDSAADCEQGLAQAARGAEPDLVLLDMQLPGLSGLAAVRAWRTRFPLVPVVVLSGEQRRQAVLDALAAGAAGFVPKATSNEVLLGALRIVLDGGRYLPPLLLEPETTPRADDPLQALGLTVRQADVLRLLARGAPNKVIGRELGLAERTVKAHVTAVLRALKVSSRTQVAIAAARFGLSDGLP
jgi:DNA-binding NarL/FixJ family response regulator